MNELFASLPNESDIIQWELILTTMNHFSVIHPQWHCHCFIPIHSEDSLKLYFYWQLLLIEHLNVKIYWFLCPTPPHKTSPGRIKELYYTNILLSGCDHLTTNTVAKFYVAIVKMLQLQMWQICQSHTIISIILSWEWSNKLNFDCRNIGYDFYLPADVFSL